MTLLKKDKEDAFMLKAVIFDLDDTLLWDHKSVKKAFETTCQIAADRHQIDPKQLEEQVRKAAEKLYPTYETYDFVSNIGIGTFEAFWGEFKDEGEDFKRLRDMTADYRKKSWLEGLRAVGIDDADFAEELAKTFPEERKKHIFLFEETLEVLDALKGKYKLCMLTNGSPHLQNTKLSMSPELAPYFDHIVISGAFGSGKPDPAIFQHALDLLGVSKNEAIMVGDNPNTDILGGLKTGIDTVWIEHGNRELGDVKPTYTINRLRELLQVIDKIES